VGLQWYIGPGGCCNAVGQKSSGRRLAAGGALVVPWLLQGGVALCLGWESTDLSKSMGVSIVGKVAAVTAA